MGQICNFGAFFKSHMPNPSSTPQTTMHTCIQNLFQVSTLYKVGEGVGGEGELQDIIYPEGTTVL